MSDRVSVVVVGGGVIGASITYYLAKAGIDVTLLERSILGAGASAAASGKISFAHGGHPYARLATESMGMFPILAEELRDVSGVDIELVECGELELAMTETDAIQMHEHQRLEEKSAWLDQREVLELEPHVNPSIIGAVHHPSAYRLNNQRLTGAFAKAAVSHGALVRQGTEVIGLLATKGRVKGVSLPFEKIYAENVVIAAGAWSGIVARWTGESGAVAREAWVRPVRGQNVNLQPAAGVIRGMVSGLWGVLVPRNDGSVIAGATVEETGFDNRVTAAGVHAIIGVASQLIPSLQEATLNWTIAGLRPGSPDDMPLLGQVPGWEGLTIAAGHYRSGIQLSPITGKLLTDHISGKASELLDAFSPSRLLC